MSDSSGGKSLLVADPLKVPEPASSGAESSTHTGLVPNVQSQEDLSTTQLPSSQASLCEQSPERLGNALALGKRPHTTTDKDGKQLSEKKLRRLAKNRVSARECRRRKREATENLQRQINVLEGENLRLRLQLQIGEEAEESMTREQTKLTEEIDELLKSGASEAEIYAALESFKEKYADYGRDRRSAIEFHLRNVERLLMPTQTTSVVMRAIQGGSNLQQEAASTTSESNADAGSSDAPASTSNNSDTATTEPANPNGNTTATGSAELPNLEPKSLFQTLVNRLNVTPEQADALKDSRFVAKEMDECFEKALAVVKELRERLAQTGENLETEFNNVRNVLSPTQAAKFLVWVANNSAAMHMLNELWDRIYPSAASAENSGDAASQAIE
ncbi:hypothetical protein ACA910_021134 [Epithemia clementina (nom. ined.)]